MPAPTDETTATEPDLSVTRAKAAAALHTMLDLVTVAPDADVDPDLLRHLYTIAHQPEG